jgi:hypothetical protein
MCSQLDTPLANCCAIHARFSASGVADSRHHG